MAYLLGPYFWEKGAARIIVEILLRPKGGADERVVE